MRYQCGCVLLAFLVTGCAGITAKNASTNEANDKGIRYYEPRPFILVHTDSKGGLTSSLIWLPDTRQVRTIRPYQFAAKNDATFSFSNGVLTQAKSVVDETVIPSAIIGALKSSALAAAGAAMNEVKDDRQTLPSPLLYAIEYLDEEDVVGDNQLEIGWTLIKSTSDSETIDLILVKQPKKEGK